MTRSARVFCGCRVIGAPAEPENAPPGLYEHECFYSLEEMYFCSDCRSLRCPFCVDKEPIAWFCPLCLFEVTSAAARRSGNLCERNCLLCPSCDANVIVRSRPEDKFSLACALCDWTLGSVFTKSKPLALQIAPNTSFAEVQKAYADGRETKLSAQPTGQPHRVRLRAKFAKKCRACAAYCVLPTPKVTSVKFSVRSLAIDYVPRVQVVSSGDKAQLLFANPCKEPVHVSLAALKSDLTILSPRIDLGPYSALDEWGPASLIDRESTASRKAYMNRTDQTVGQNWVLVDFEAPPGRHNLLMNVQYDGYELGVWLAIVAP